MNIFILRNSAARPQASSKSLGQEPQPVALQTNAKFDYDDAIAAHENWKMRLLAYLEGRSSEDFRPEQLNQDDQCMLGRWLHAKTAAEIRNSAALQYLHTQHKMLHHAASSVVALYHAQRSAEAEIQFFGPFLKYSRNVKRSLEDMKLLARLSPKPAIARPADYDEGPVYGIR